MKIFINTDCKTYGLPRFLIKYIEKLGMRDYDDDRVVFNIDSISNKGMRKGKECTVYFEGDEYLKKGSLIGRYEMCDILYIGQPNYLKYYPEKTKILKMGVDPEFHYPRNVVKDCDYVFVGKTSGNPVYDHRRGILEELSKSKYKVKVINNGNPEYYSDDMSSGRIILSLFPRLGDEVCIALRTLEGMAIGCVMCEHDSALADYGFIPNVHYLPIERFGEDFSDEEIASIHKTSREYVINNFSTENAVKQIIKDMEAL